MNKVSSVVLAVSLLLAGCVPMSAPSSAPAPASNGEPLEKAQLRQDYLEQGYVVKVIDRGLGVVCFVYVSVGISCIPMSKTSFGGQE